MFGSGGKRITPFQRERIDAILNYWFRKDVKPDWDRTQSPG